jgi:hypothetical protein
MSCFTQHSSFLLSYLGLFQSSPLFFRLSFTSQTISVIFFISIQPALIHFTKTLHFFTSSRYLPLQLYPLTNILSQSLNNQLIHLTHISLILTHFYIMSYSDFSINFNHFLCLLFVIIITHILCISTHITSTPTFIFYTI